MERIKYVTFQYEAEITQEKGERKGETENCAELREREGGRGWEYTKKN